TRHHATRGARGRDRHRAGRCSLLHPHRPSDEGAFAVRQSAGGSTAAPHASTEAGLEALTARVRAGRLARRRRYLVVCGVLTVLILAMLAISLMFGRQFFGPGEVLRVLLGEQVPGASFTVGVLRLPRALVGALAGVAFGMAGITFQTM